MSWNDITHGLESKVDSLGRKIQDDSLKQNAENASEVGLVVLVSRTYDGIGLSNGRICQWCKDRECTNVTLQEAYNIGAFQRHEGCECIIEYITNKGVKTIQTGKYSGWNFADELEKRKSIGLDEQFFADELMSRVDKYAEIPAVDLYENAKNGGSHSGTYRQAIKKPKPHLENSIKSHIRQVEEHEWKIQHPELGMKREDPNDPVERVYAIKKWLGDRLRNAQEAIIELEVWRRLYGR